MKNPISFLFSGRRPTPTQAPVIAVQVNNNTLHQSYGYIHLPIDIHLDTLQRTLNKKYPTGYILNKPRIFEPQMVQDSYVDLHVTKLSDLIITEEMGMLCLQMRLRVTAPLNFFNRWTGNLLTGTPSFTGMLNIKTSLSFENLQLNLGFEYTQITWDNWGSSLYGMSVTNFIADALTNRVINFFKPRLVGYLRESFNLPSQLKKISTAQEIAPSYHLWFAMQPLSIYAGKLVFQNKKIKLNLEMHTQIEISVGQRPSLTFNENNIQIMQHSVAPSSHINVKLPMFVSYLSITEILQQKLLGSYLTKNGLVENPKGFSLNPISNITGSSLITRVHLSKGTSPTELTIQIRFRGGAFEGEHTLSGTPIYHAAKNEVHLQKVHYSIGNQSSKRLKVLDLFKRTIVKLIESSAVIPLEPYIASGIEKTNTYFNQHETLKDLVSIELQSFGIKELSLTEQALQLVVQATGKVSIGITTESEINEPGWVVV